MAAKIDSASFRDPSGHVYLEEDRVYRSVLPPHKNDFEEVRNTGLIQDLTEKKWLTEESQIDPSVVGESSRNACYVLQHPKLPMISYPYEWGFSLLKSAAIHHLDVHLCALDYDITLVDASAYNVQFSGTRPIFIDNLSFRPYKKGEFWRAHDQFCRQFINPLLLWSELGVSHNAWFRGSMEGIDTRDLSQLLPWRKKISWQIFCNVVLPAHFQSANRSDAKAQQSINTKTLSKQAFVQMLRSLKKWILNLKPHKSLEHSTWSDYEDCNSYEDKQREAKESFIKSYVSKAGVSHLADFGCNSGEYSELALKAGADLVTAFDFDHGALERAYSKAKQRDLRILPLYLDITNPSPSQGWNSIERAGLEERLKVDGVIALALVHHLAIAKNIPLNQAIEWVLRKAPSGVIEFIPKSDPMVGKLLALREDIFPDYSRENFIDIVNQNARIVATQEREKGGRELIWFDKNNLPEVS